MREESSDDAAPPPFLDPKKRMALHKSGLEALAAGEPSALVQDSETQLLASCVQRVPGSK